MATKAPIPGLDQTGRGDSGITGSSTTTLTNKRVTPRVAAPTPTATPTINTDTCDAVTIVGLATPITSLSAAGDSPAGNLTGTPQNFERLTFRFKDNGSPQGITWGPKFASRGATLPTTTTASKVTHVALLWNSVTSTWDCVATVTEA